MSAPQTYRRWVVGVAALTVGITVTHVLEDFVYGVPARFGLAVLPAAALLGAVYTVHVLVIVLTSSDRNSGYLGNLVFGTLWLSGALFDHLDDVLLATSYRAGWWSKTLELGVVASALALITVSLLALRSWRSL